MLVLKKSFVLLLFIITAFVVSSGETRARSLLDRSEQLVQPKRIQKIRSRVMFDVEHLAAREDEGDAKEERTEKVVTISDRLIPVFIVGDKTRIIPLSNGYAFSFNSGPTSTIKFVFPTADEGGETFKADVSCECDEYRTLTREDGKKADNENGYTIIGFSKIGSKNICNKIIGTDGNDILIGGDNQDFIYAGAGWDTIEGGHCGDTVYVDSNDVFQDNNLDEGDQVKDSSQWAVDMGE